MASTFIYMISFNPWEFYWWSEFKQSPVLQWEGGMNDVSCPSVLGYLRTWRVKSSQCSGQVGLMEGQDVPVLQTA